MPKAEFKPVLEVHGGKASVSGPLSHDDLRPALMPDVQYVHWLLVQEREISAGLAEIHPGQSEWRSQDSSAHDWVAGAAQAVGVILTVRPAASGGNVLETFTWSQQVTFEVG